MNRSETLPRVDGREIPASFHLGRCEAERYARSADGGWERVRGCDLAFYFRLPSSAKNRFAVSCPGCGLSLDVTTRRLRAGFLFLNSADVKAIIAAKGEPVEVSCLSPIVSDVVVEALAPRDVRQEGLRQKAEAALVAFDAKPRCAVCWGYNASVKKSDRCGFCQAWDASAGQQHAQGERDGYCWKRQELVERVEKYGGAAAPSPVAGYADHIAARDARRAEERARRVAELRARGVRV